MSIPLAFQAGLASMSSIKVEKQYLFLEAAPEAPNNTVFQR
jgi:hypothetical protein